MSPMIVGIRDVYKSYGTVPVLRGMTFDVNKGEVICIIGPSGYGKSPLLRCINALIPLDSGSINMSGIEANSPMLNKLELRKRVGMVFQHFSLFPHKTSIENVMMAPVQVLKLDKKSIRDRATSLLEKVRLADKLHSYPGQLSGGQQRRVAIARSLAMNSDVMLFDEVTSALDSETVNEALVVILGLVEDGMTCLIVTHEMGFAREVSNHIYFTDRGVIVERGEPDAFFSAPSDPRTREFLSQIL